MHYDGYPWKKSDPVMRKAVEFLLKNKHEWSTAFLATFGVIRDKEIKQMFPSLPKPSPDQKPYGPKTVGYLARLQVRNDAPAYRQLPEGNNTFFNNGNDLELF